MKLNLTQKILGAHSRDDAGSLVQASTLKAGDALAVRIDQSLTQDATGTMACLQFEAIGVDRVKTDLSVSYVDHNTLQMGFRNADDHQFLRTMAAKFGIIYSPPGTGICHQLHLENFAKPGTTLLGSDSHTPTAGGLGAFAMGAGGLSVALAMAGQPYRMSMPQVVRVRLEGTLQGWASAKDVILHLLGKLTVKGGVGKVFEYTGSGVATLSVPERACITNMGAELGATTSIFPSDVRTQEFLTAMGRAQDFVALEADAGASYDAEVLIDLSALEPLVAQPHMPDRVVPVSQLAGLVVNQVAIGSCTNSSFADLQAVAQVFDKQKIAPSCDVMISPGSKQVLKMLVHNGSLEKIIDSGARLLECACGPCIGMGGSPVSAGVSVRTFNRNFEGRSATKDASVYLVSPLTAAMVALHGAFTDPATWGTAPAMADFPATVPSIRDQFILPPPSGKDVTVLRGPNIQALETFSALPEVLNAIVVLKVGDNITTDHIMPAGAEITALRSNVPAIAMHVFSRVDSEFVARAKAVKNGLILAGENYGQGSSREHAALAPRHLGIRVLLARSLARIHRDNLVNFGIVPLVLVDAASYDMIPQGATVSLRTADLMPGKEIRLTVDGVGDIMAKNDLTSLELKIIKAGGLLNHVRCAAN